MPNENMAVMAAMARKGGSGKSMLVKALASAAAASDQRVLLIDFDPQGDLSGWFARATANRLVGDKASLVAARTVEEVGELVRQAYEDNAADFVVIDTAGSAGAWADDVAVMVDVVVTPVVASESDFAVGRQTVEWFKGLRERVDDPEALPPHRVVLNNFPNKATKLELQLFDTAIRDFPVIDHVMQRRNAYLQMDAMGFLGNIVASYREQANPLERHQARRFDEALVEAVDVLNDLLGG